MFKIYKVGDIYTKYMINVFKNELALIRWNPRVQTPIHNHGNKLCNFYILGGALNEVKYKEKSIHSLTTSHTLTSFKKNTVDISEYHQIFNLDNVKKWSIHYYYEPVDKL